MKTIFSPPIGGSNPSDDNDDNDDDNADDDDDEHDDIRNETEICTILALLQPMLPHLCLNHPCRFIC